MKHLPAYFFILSFLLFGQQTVTGQSNISVAGRVVDASSGQPLPGAVVQVVDGYEGAVCDDDGVFLIENLPEGNYRLRVELLSYTAKIINGITVRPEQTARVEIALRAQPLMLDSVSVTGLPENDQFLAVQDRRVISSGELARYRRLGIAGVLEVAAGLQVTSEGGGGSRARVSIHGGTANQVLVLLDGQRLNDPQTGEVDLSRLSLEQIEQIEIIPQGNSAEFGGNAFAGMVALHSIHRPKKNRLSLGGNGGSFTTAGGRAALEWRAYNSGLIADYQQEYSLQNFDYQHNGDTKTRRNAWYRTRKLFGKFSTDRGRHTFVLQAQGQQGSRGLPSTPFDAQIPYNPQVPFNPAATERMLAAQARHGWTYSPRFLLETRLAINHLWQRFAWDDAALSRKKRYREESSNAVLEGETRLRLQPHSRLELQAGAKFLRESLKQENLLYTDLSIGEKQRNTAAFFTSGNFALPVLPAVLKDLRLHLALRYETIFQNSGLWFPFAGLILSPAALPWLSLYGNLSRAVRYPDFNSLFWVGNARARGNPDLMPERKTARQAGLRFRPEPAYLPRGSVSYFSEEIFDLIQWYRRFDGVWEPRNEERVEKQGWDFQIEQSLWAGHIQLRAAWSHVQALNRKQDPVLYGKRLIFVPENSLSLSIWLEINRWNFLLSYSSMSDRETVAANSRGTQIAPYRVLDLSAGTGFSIRGVETDLNLLVKNILEENYQLVLGYPMPGREFLLRISIHYPSKY